MDVRSGAEGVVHCHHAVTRRRGRWDAQQRAEPSPFDERIRRTRRPAPLAPQPDSARLHQFAPTAGPIACSRAHPCCPRPPLALPLVAGVPLSSVTDSDREFTDDPTKKCSTPNQQHRNSYRPSSAATGRWGSEGEAMSDANPFERPGPWQHARKALSVRRSGKRPTPRHLSISVLALQPLGRSNPSAASAGQTAPLSALLRNPSVRVR